MFSVSLTLSFFLSFFFSFFLFSTRSGGASQSDGNANVTNQGQRKCRKKGGGLSLWMVKEDTQLAGCAGIDNQKYTAKRVANRVCESNQQINKSGGGGYQSKPCETKAKLLRCILFRGGHFVSFVFDCSRQGGPRRPTEWPRQKAHPDHRKAVAD